MVDLALIRARFASLSPHLDERGRRLLAASKAQAAGHGGIVAVSCATGLAPSTIGRGLRELAEGTLLPPGGVRRAGGGHKTLAAADPGLRGALVSPTERADPMSPLRWTCKSSAASSPSWTREAAKLERLLLVNAPGTMLCVRKTVRLMFTRHGGRGGGDCQSLVGGGSNSKWPLD